jgi:hypothetical protein
MIESGRRRFGGRDSEEIDLSNLMSLYNAVKEDEKERDDEIKHLDVSYEFLTVCIELMVKKPKIARRYVSLPNLISVIMFIAKTNNSVNDMVVESFVAMLNEYFDEPTYVPKLKNHYIDFLESIIRRVDSDSRERGEFLTIFKNIGKTAGGMYTELGRDLKSYARARFNDKKADNEDEDDDEDDEGEDNNSSDNYMEEVMKEMNNESSDE